MHNAQALATTLWEAVKKRSQQPTLESFGDYLEGLRGTVSREIISRRLAALGVPLGGSTLAQYEKGAVWAPDAGVLWGLGRIYRVPLEDLVNRLRANRVEALDLEVSHGSINISRVDGEAAHDDASLRDSSPAQLVSADPPVHGQSRPVPSTLEDAIQDMREATAALRLAYSYATANSGKAVGKSGRQAAKARARVATKRRSAGRHRRKSA